MALNNELFYFAGRNQEHAEMMNKCTELLAKLESGFSALMNATIGKFGQHLSGIFKDSLECSICKELIIEVNIFKFQKIYIIRL